MIVAAASLPLPVRPQIIFLAWLFSV